MRRFRLSASAVVFLLVVIIASYDRSLSAQTPNAQTADMAIGQSPYAMYNDASSIDHYNPANGNIYLSIPLLSYPQIGSHLRLAFNIYYNDKQWYIPNFHQVTNANGSTYYSGSWSWWNTNLSQSQVDSIGVYVARDQHLDFGQDDVTTQLPQGSNEDQYLITLHQRGYFVRGSDGSKHYYGDEGDQSCTGACQGFGYWFVGNLYTTTDGTGFIAGAGASIQGGANTVLDASGVSYTASATGETITDPNGNSIVSSANGWTDTLGRELPGSTSPPGYSDNADVDISFGKDPVPGVPTSLEGAGCPSTAISAREWLVPAEGGTTQPYYLCYSPFKYATTFNLSSYNSLFEIAEATSSDQYHAPALLLSAIVLPNHTSYTFSYDSYLSLSAIGLPTGGSIVYTWQNILMGTNSSAPISRALSTRQVNTGTSTATWYYNWQLNETINSSGDTVPSLPYWDVVTDPLGNDAEYEIGGLDDAGNNAYLSMTRYMQYTGCGPHDSFGHCSSSGSLMKTTSYVLTQVGSLGADPGTPSFSQSSFSPLTQPSTVTTTWPVSGGNRISKVVKTFSPAHGSCSTYATGSASIQVPQANPLPGPCYQYIQPQSMASYAYGASGAGSLIHTDTTTYQWQQSSAYLSANMLDYPYSVVRSGPSGHWAAETDYGYDGAGDQTSVSKLLSQGHGLTTSTGYNSQGMPTLITDPKGHETSISYQCSGAFPESVITPYQSTTTTVETTTYGYDCTTGEMTSRKDPNNYTTGYSYADSLNRLTGVSYPDGGNITLAYDDTMGSLSLTTTQATGGPEGPLIKESEYDGLGRPIHQIVSSDTSGADYVDTTYDSLGRVASVSNPHRPTHSVPTEDGTTTYTYDALGRKVREVEADGVSTQQWCFGGLSQIGATNCHPNEAANSDYWEDHADETTRDWQQTTDSLGRISEAMEPNASNVPSLKTDYTYDLNDNLVSVLQHGASGDTARGRTFVYDPLSRLTNACNPEALASGSSACGANGPWSQIYSYDGDGNVYTRTDAKNVVTTYLYDDLDRVTAKNYSDGQTLNAYYMYDANACGNPTDPDVGHLTGSWTSSSTINIGYYGNDPNAVGIRCYFYDVMGRVAATDTDALVSGNPYGFGGEIFYNYDLAGRVSIFSSGPNYPTNSPYHGFDYAYDDAGNLLSITLDTNPENTTGVPSSIPTTIFQAAAKNGQPAYSAMGLEHGELSVNTSGQPVMYYDHTFDQRGRPASSMYTTGAGAVGGGGSQLYSYTMSYLGNGSVNSAADSVLGTINVGNSGYDNLNRLTSLSYAGGAYGGINAAWTYDNFGNQLSQTLSGSSSTPVPSNTTTHYNAQNQISFTSRDGNALPYDGDGNLYYDVQYAYAYDAENRLCAIKAGNTYKIYVYDADGNRIAKGNISPQGTPNPPTVALCNPQLNDFAITQAYALGLNGEEIENYTPDNTWHNTNVFADGKVIATYAGNYMSIPALDWQGTRRAQLRNNQAISGVMNFLSLPYGDGFTMVGGTSFDTLVQYTQQQYNQEDNLYNFKARYYGDWVGRFMSPDYNGTDDYPSPVPYSDLSNPQTLNLYAYAGNNPLKNIDEDGHEVWLCATGASTCTHFNDDQWQAFLQQQTAAVQNGTNGGITISGNGFMGTGTISCGGQECGQAIYNQEGLHDETGDILGAYTFGKVGGFAVGKTFGFIGGLFGRGAGEAAGEAAGKAGGAAVDVANLSAKITKQMATRGWTAAEITETVENGTAHAAVNKATGGAATEFVNPANGKFVVVDNATKQVIQVSGPGFRPNYLGKP